MLGGVLIGLIESLGGQYLAVRWTDVIIFSILVLVLVFRPTGLLGRAAPNQILSALHVRNSASAFRDGPTTRHGTRSELHSFHMGSSQGHGGTAAASSSLSSCLESCFR